MTIDPFTFVLEIVNFLVLLWLLHRFLYRPIQEAIAQRRQTLNQELVAAQQREEEALALKSKFEQSIADWEKEKARQEDALQLELGKRQAAALTKVREAAEAERIRLQSLSQQELESQRHQAQLQAAQAALQLSSRMLQRLAGSALDQSLLQMLSADLEQLPESDRSRLQAAFSRTREPVAVTTARILDQELQQRLIESLSAVLASDIRCSFNLDPELLSGYRIVIGDQVVHANLGEELAFFARSLIRAVH